MRPDRGITPMLVIDKRTLTAFARELAKAGTTHGLQLKHQTWSTLALVALGLKNKHAAQATLQIRPLLVEVPPQLQHALQPRWRAIQLARLALDSPINGPDSATDPHGLQAASQKLIETAKRYAEEYAAPSSGNKASSTAFTGYDVSGSDWDTGPERLRAAIAAIPGSNSPGLDVVTAILRDAIDAALTGSKRSDQKAPTEVSTTTGSVTPIRHMMDVETRRALYRTLRSMMNKGITPLNALEYLVRGIGEAEQDAPIAQALRSALISELHGKTIGAGMIGWIPEPEGRLVSLSQSDGKGEVAQTLKDAGWIAQDDVDTDKKARMTMLMFCTAMTTVNMEEIDAVRIATTLDWSSYGSHGPQIAAMARQVLTTMNQGGSWAAGLRSVLTLNEWINLGSVHASSCSYQEWRKAVKRLTEAG